MSRLLSDALGAGSALLRHEWRQAGEVDQRGRDVRVAVLVRDPVECSPQHPAGVVQRQNISFPS